MNAVWNVSKMRPYSRQLGSSSGVAPSSTATGSSSARPKALNSTPSTAVATTSILNSRFARFSSPAPSVMATRALPPVPIIKPRQPSI